MVETALAPGDRVELEIAQIGERGQGIARHGDATVHVPGVFPGERALVRIEARSRFRPEAHARALALVQASPSRRVPPCPRHESHREGGCSGCPLMALELEAQREAKRVWVREAHGLELAPGQLIGGEELHYRWSSKRLVAGKVGGLVLGSRAAGRGPRRGRVADMHGCLVDHPTIEAAFSAAKRHADELGVEPWRGREDGGDLRYLWAKTNGREVLLTLITGTEDSLAAGELGLRLFDEGVVAGVAWSVQPSSGNVIRGRAPEPLIGAQTLRFELEGHAKALELGPLGFLQPNPIVAGLAQRDLVGPPPAEAESSSTSAGPAPGLALDLYAGAGLTTALLRERFDEVIPCDAYPESALALGVAAQTVEAFSRERAATGDAKRPELVVANPPRAGFGDAVCELLVKLGAPRLQIMSCSPRSLARDLARLRPGYELVALRGYDTLPQTAHLELVAWLGRRGDAEGSGA